MKMLQLVKYAQINTINYYNGKFKLLKIKASNFKTTMLLECIASNITKKTKKTEVCIE